MTIQAGVVGLGFMGRRYVEFLHKLPGVRVAGVFDIRKDLAVDLAEEVGARAFADARDLAAANEVDAIFVCTPEDQHLEASLAAIQAKKALLIEKPVAHSLEAAEAIAGAARAGGTLVMVGHLLRFEPRWAAAKQAVDDGMIGQVVSISARRVGNVLDQGVLKGRTTIPLYYGVHDLDIVRWLAGAEAVTLYASRRSGVLRSHGYDVHDLYSAILNFENEVLATAELGWHVPPIAAAAPTSGFNVVGTEGWLQVDQAATGLQFWSKKDSLTVHPVIDVTFWPAAHGLPGGALAAELQHFLECMNTGSQPVITLADGIEALRLSLAMEASAEQEKVIQLAEFGKGAIRPG